MNNFKEYYFKESSSNEDKIRKLIDNYKEKNKGTYISGGGKLTHSKFERQGSPYIALTGKNASNIGAELAGEIKKLGVTMGRYGPTRAGGYMIPITKM